MPQFLHVFKRCVKFNAEVDNLAAMYVCIYVCMYVYMCVCMYTCMYV